MKRKSDKKKLAEKADRQFQDWIRANYPKEKCWVCGGKYELCHHIIEKSKCAGLRFDIRNLSFLCSKCHCKHHLSGDPNIIYMIGKKIDIGNLIKLQYTEEIKKIKADTQFFEEQLKKWTISN